MDIGKIFLKFALIALSVTMVINPANAAGCDTSCSVGNRNVHFPDGVSADGSPPVAEKAVYPAAPVICQTTMEMLLWWFRK
ncbi:MAG: hypothetical protein WCF90_02400 [Methanomicrobiales archaeon]